VSLRQGQALAEPGRDPDDREKTVDAVEWFVRPGKNDGDLAVERGAVGVWEKTNL